MPSIFSKIVNGSIQAHIVAENAHFMAFLDAFPLKRGHVLVIPKKETDYIFDLEDAEYLELMSFAKKVGKAIKKAIPCERVSIHVIGLEVPHVHIHLIPINHMSDCNFHHEKLQFTRHEFEETAQLIAAQL